RRPRLRGQTRPLLGAAGGPEIDDAWHDQAPIGLNLALGLKAGRTLTDCQNPAVIDKQVRDAVQLPGRVEQPAAADFDLHERTSCAAASAICPLMAMDITAMRTALPLVT